MAAPVCPIHNKPMRINNPKFGWSCPTVTAYDPDTGKKTWCNYKPPKEAVVPASELPATPAKPAAGTTSSGSPRLQAAIAALQASARVSNGATETLRNAARFYHEFLKLAFLGEAPQPEVFDQAQPPEQQEYEGSASGGPDDDIPF